jgi:hypothetical protein
MKNAATQIFLFLFFLECLFTGHAFCYQMIDRTFDFDIQNSDITIKDNGSGLFGKSLHLSGNVDLFSLNVNDVINTYVHFANPIVLTDLHTGFYSGWGKTGIEPLSFGYRYYSGTAVNTTKFSVELDVIAGQAAWTSIYNQTASNSGSGFSAMQTYGDLTDSFVVIEGMTLWTRISSISNIQYVNKYDLEILASDISVGWVPEPATLLLLGLGAMMLRRRK